MSLDKSGFLGCHVIDILVVGSADLTHSLRTYLSAALQITDLGNATIYAGINILRNRLARTIMIEQRTYIDSLFKSFNLQDSNAVGTPIAENKRDHIIRIHTSGLDDRREYQKLIGCLLFLANGTRADIAYVVKKESHDP